MFNNWSLSQMEKKAELYRGKAKSVFATDDPKRLIMLFRDDTSAFDGQKIEQLARKGKTNNKFNYFIMKKLEEAGIPKQSSPAAWPISMLPSLIPTMQSLLA